MFRLFCLLILLFGIAGCQKMVKPEVVNEINNRFKIAIEQREKMAKAGQITWVQSQQEIRDLDKGVKERLDATGASHTWHYDTWDEEYYAFCIALAEKLDQKEITFAEFDAERIERFNAIEARRQELDAQQQLLNSQRQLLIQQSLERRTSYQEPSGQMQQPNSQAQPPNFTIQSRSNCRYVREWVSGNNRNCVFNCVLTGDVIETIDSFKPCPFSINR